MSMWSPDSWAQYAYEQSAEYPDHTHLNSVVNQLHTLPPLVSYGEINALKQLIAKAGCGKAFILQGGDCAELFNDCRENIIRNKLKIILQMSLVLIYGLRKPVIRIGRIAGQYTKPRSCDYEIQNGKKLPSYRGDLVNCPEFSEQARTPNPDLLLRGYHCAATTLNYIRSLLAGGFANLHYPQQWDLSFIDHSAQAEEYQTMVHSISNSIDFLNVIDGLQNSNLNDVDFFTSHEALHLHYEQALTRCASDGHWYNLSTHLPWIGMRTAKPHSAHLELLRGVNNPIGIKIGPQTSPDWLNQMLLTLNPHREAGKILLISRMGVQHIESLLPPLIEKVALEGHAVTWSCDPMHGNTEMTKEGIKTRHFDNILHELKSAIEIHHQMNSYLGGVHLELTGENVTECIGGARGLMANDLKQAYHSLVDPRLNYEQSLEIAFQLSNHHK